MAQEPIYRRVAATIGEVKLLPGSNSHGESRGYVIKVPWSDYPAQVNTRDAALWSHLKPKSSQVLILVRGKAKTGKEGSEKDRDYYWNIAGIEGIKEPEGYKPPPATADSEEHTTDAGSEEGTATGRELPKLVAPGHAVDDGRSGRQTALNVAAQVFGPMLVEGKEIPPETVNRLLRLAAYISHFLNEGWVPEPKK